MAVAQGVAMQSHYILPYLHGLKGITGLYYRNNLSEKAKHKLKAYQLYKYEKIKMDTIAIVFDVHKATVSRWIKEVQKAKEIGRYEILEPKSTTPHNTPREKKIDVDLKKVILEIRGEYKCGKDKIATYLQRDYDIKIAPSTIHRFLTKLPRCKDPKYTKKKSKVTKRNRRKELIRINQVVDRLTYRAFERFQIDTKHWVINNRTFFIICAVDVITRMAFAYAYTRHTANCARDFLIKLNYLYSLRGSKAYIQRDNGTEFMGEFERECENMDICVVTNYVRQPKMNGVVERFNRSLKEEVLQYNDVYTVQEVNECLKNYIITYNFDRVHDSLDKLTPFEKCCEMKFNMQYDKIFEFKLPLLQRYRTCTNCCVQFHSMV